MGYKFPSIHRLSGLVHPPGAEHSGTSASPEWPFSYSRDRFNLIRPSNAILIQTVTPLGIENEEDKERRRKLLRDIGDKS